MYKIKFLALIIILSFGILSCGKLTNDEINVGKVMGMSKEDLLFIKNSTNSKIDNFETKINDTKGLKVSVDYDKTESIRKFLSDKYKTKGYLVFIAAYFNDPNRNNILGIIKSTDQFDIVRIQKTASNKKKHSTKDIVNQLISWDKEFKFEITRAGDYWIDANFITKPTDMNKFAKELTKFCPEILNDGTGKIEDVINGMNSSNSFNMIF